VAVAVLIIAAVVVSALLGIAPTQSALSSTQGENAPAEDELLQVSGLPTLYHEKCISVYSPFAPTTCDSTTSTVGIPQTFNMSSLTGPNGSVTTYENFFAFQLNGSSTIQFTFRTMQPALTPAALTVYFAGSGVNFTDLRGDVYIGRLPQVTNSGFASNPGLIPVDRFSGQVAASPGVYIFDFEPSNGGGGAAYFLVRDATALHRGIGVSIGSPEVSSVSSSGSACEGGPMETGVGEESFPIKVTSNTTTDVDLSPLSVPFGVWVKFVPSQLHDVGPQGAESTMIIVGDVYPEGGNPHNASLFVDAFSPAGSLTGEAVLPLDGSFGLVNVLSSVAPVGEVPGDYPAILFSRTDFAGNQTGYSPVAAGNQTNYALLGNVYDPVARAGTTSASSLSVTITHVGLIQNGTEVALPAWLAVRPVSTQFVLTPDQPYQLQVCV